MIQIIQGDIKFNRIEKDVLSRLKKAMATNIYALIGHVKTEYLTGGTTDTRLKVRTGRLRASVKPMPVKSTSHGIESGISFGTNYAQVHIGRKGIITTIKPKNVSMLTIPLPPVMTASGVVKGTARSFMTDKGVFGNTFIARSKKGNLLIFGQSRIMKGSRIGQLKNNIVPLFVLKKSVKIKTRVHPSNILKWIKPKLLQDIKQLRG